MWQSTVVLAAWKSREELSLGSAMRLWLSAVFPSMSACNHQQLQEIQGSLWNGLYCPSWFFGYHSWWEELAPAADHGYSENCSVQIWMSRVFSYSCAGISGKKWSPVFLWEMVCFLSSFGPLGQCKLLFPAVLFTSVHSLTRADWKCLNFWTWKKSSIQGLSVFPFQPSLRKCGVSRYL